MNLAIDGRTRQLQDAFQAFTRMSEQLEGSYRELEQRVQRLNEELAAARGERLRQLAEKERLADRLQKLLAALPAAVVVLDGDECIQDCNPAALDLLGEPLVGRPWSEVHLRAAGTASTGAPEVVLKNGRVVSLTRRPLESEPGSILVLQDVTEVRAMQDTINQNKRLSAMGEMAAGMAHQIRTPLATALLYVSQLGRSDLRVEDRRRFADKVLARLRHMESQVNDMLTFAKGGRFGLEPLTVAELLDEARSMLETQLRPLGADLRVENHADGRLTANKEALLGALGNLADNAANARPEGLRLTLRAELDADAHLLLRMCDNGPGMDRKTRERIFDPFYTTRPQGTGLGLAVVQAVVHAHNGLVAVESRPGSGAEFLLTLPLLEAPAAHRETAQTHHERQYRQAS